MDASIVIASFNGRSYIQRCLHSIYEHISGLTYEVIVVDNASSDGTPALIRERFPQVTLIARPNNAGFSRAINQGIAAASGEAFLVLNPDCEMTSNVLPPMLEFVQNEPDVGLLAPKLVDSDGTLQLSCRSFPGFSAALFNRYSLLTRLFPNNRFSSGYLMLDFDHARVADVDWISAACWLVPRAAFERIGPLDEAYFWTFEDVDYCQRAKRSGLRIVYFPEASVIHHIGGSARSAPARSIMARHRGMWRYYRTYMQPPGFMRPFANALMAAAIAGRCAMHLGTGAVWRLLKTEGD